MKRYLLAFLTTALIATMSCSSDNTPSEEQQPTLPEEDVTKYANPFIRHMYTADPSARVWGDGRLYVYASHDIDPPRGCDLMDQYHVFSTDDMINWTDHGEILRAGDVPWGTPDGNFMWAPDCVYKNGTYYFYFPHPSGSPWNSTWKIGVATSAKPANDFVVQGYIEGLESLIDPCVFVDDDGQAYFYHGGGNICMGGKLKDNMIEIDGKMQQMSGLADYHEATWVHKYKGTYYLSYADNNGQGGNSLRYATSKNPLGPWTYQGVYLDPTGCSTSHGSIVEYKGQWYAFYHNKRLSGNDNLRSICVDQLFYDTDGMIKKVKQSKDFGTPYKNILRPIPGIIEAEDFNEGGQGIGYCDSDAENIGEQYRPDEGVDIEGNGGIYNIGFTNNGEFTNYTIDVTQAGEYEIQSRVASGVTGGGSFHLEIDGVNLSGTLTVPNFGWGVWITVSSKKLSLTKGTHVLTFFTYGGMNIDNFTFALSK